MTAWKFEYRGFMGAEPTDVLAQLEMHKGTDGLFKKDQTWDDWYATTPNSDVAIRVRSGSIKIKGPVKKAGDIAWQMQDDRPRFPLHVQDLAAIGIKQGIVARLINGNRLQNLDELKEYVSDRGALVTTPHVTLTKYEGSRCEIEVGRFELNGNTQWTVGVSGATQADVEKAVREQYCAIASHIGRGNLVAMSYAAANQKWGK